MPDKNNTELVAKYREAREALIKEVEKMFPPHQRCWPVGATTGNWGSYVRREDHFSRRELSADMVYLIWDNGNRFPQKIDEIELESK